MLYSFNQYMLLVESKRKDQLKNKYVDKLGLDEEIFNSFYANKNTEWLLKIYSNITDEKKQEINGKGRLTLPEILIEYVEMFDKNKENLDVDKISDIKSLDDMKDTLDSLRDFDGADGTYGDDIWVLDNTYEWFIFKPYTYDASELANNKHRENNWCTTYDDAAFKEYLGHNGGLLYICNKLDKTKDVAISFGVNEDGDDTIDMAAWNWKDSNIEQTSNLSNLMTRLWKEDEEPYKILMENLSDLEGDTPKVDWDKARKKARIQLNNMFLIDLYDEYCSNDIGMILRNIRDDDFLDDIKKVEYERYYNEWRSEGNDELLKIFKEICEEDYDNWSDESRNEFREIFKAMMVETNEDYEYDEDEGYNTNNPSLSDIIEYIESEVDGETAIDAVGLDDEVIEKLATNFMKNHSNASEYIDSSGSYDLDNLGNMDRDEIKRLFEWIKSYVDFDGLVDDIIKGMDSSGLKNFAN